MGMISDCGTSLALVRIIEITNTSKEDVMGLKVKMVLVAALIGFSSLASAAYSKPSQSADPNASRSPKIRAAMRSTVCPLMASKVTSHESAPKELANKGDSFVPRNYRNNGNGRSS